MRDRILAERPATLAEIGVMFGGSRHRVAQHEGRPFVPLERLG